MSILVRAEDRPENRRDFRRLFTDYARYMASIGADFWHICADGRIAPMGNEEQGDGVEDAFALPGSFLYFIQADGQHTGFAWITTRDFPHHRDDRDIYLAEFFIAPEHRRQGLGGKAFAELLDLHRGEWVLGILQNNRDALTFWPKALDQALTARPHISTPAIEEDEESRRYRFFVS